MENLTGNIVKEKLIIDYWYGKISHSLANNLILVNKNSVPEASAEVIEEMIDEKIADRINVIAKGNTTSEFVIYLTLYSIILNKYFGLNKVYIAVPNLTIDTNTKAYDNLLFLELDVDCNKTIKELIKANSNELQLAFNYREYNFNTLSDVFKDNAIEINDYLNFSFTYNIINDKFSYGKKAPLILNMIKEDNGALRFEFKFDSVKVCHHMMRQIANSFQLALPYINKSDTKVLEMDLMDPSEKEKILYSFNSKYNETAIKKSVVEMFEEQVKKTPDQLALVFEKVRLTYSQLFYKVSELSDFLIAECKINKGDIVGVYLNRSESSVIAMISILKVGAVYLPLDISQPRKRIEFIINDLEPKIILTEATLYNLVDEGKERFKIMPTVFKQYIIDKKKVKISSSDSSFIIYTSGSTGNPKGVVQTHRTLSNLIWWDNTYSQLEPGLKILQYSSYGFDSSLHDVFFALSNGGSVFVVNDETKYNFHKLAKYIAENKIEILSFPYSALSQFFNYTLNEEFKNHAVKHIISTGEQLLIGKQIEFFLDENPNVKLHNFYGPTETHVVTSYIIPGEKLKSIGRVPIGKPIANSQIYILDENNNLAPIGVSGEIFIGGYNLAEGYYNNTELTEAKFVPNPFVSDKQFLYKSGDIGKWLPDGNLIYQYRKDNQVKVRGYRIELGEIEQLLLKHEAVNEAIVLISGEDNDKHIHAYFSGDKAITVTELKEYLKEYLPPYMIPNFIIKLDFFPLTGNGKIDTKALLAASQIKPENEYAIFVNDLQKELVDIWENILGHAKIGIKDNFFELGGHSMKAIELLDAIRIKYKVEIPLHEIIEKFNIESLELLIKKSKQSELQGYIESVVPDIKNRYKSFPLNNIQQAYLIGRSPVFELGNIATLSYQEYDVEKLDIDRFDYAVQKLIERHEVLRLIVNESGEQQILENVPQFKSKTIDLRAMEEIAKEETLECLRKEMSNQLLPLGFPLYDIRTTLLHDNLVRIHFCIDTMILDAKSMSIFMNELSLNYVLPKFRYPSLLFSFRDYVLAEIDFQKTELFQKSKEYWQSRLMAIHPAPELPTIQDAAQITKPTFKKYKHHIEKDQWNVIKDLASKNGISPTAFLLAVYSEILGLWSKSQFFTINLTLFNRIPFHKQVNEILGDFTSISLLSVDVSAQTSFRDRIRQLQKQLWTDIEHRFYSGVEVVRDLAKIEGSANRAIMPIVFTSTIGLGDDLENTTEFENIPAEILDQLPSNYSEVFSSFQTSQVWIDHIVHEVDGGLEFIWTVVEELFPKYLTDDMFNAYIQLLMFLAEDEKHWERKSFDIIPGYQKKALDKYNETNYCFEEDSFLQLFNKSVQKFPDQVAIQSSNCSLSYFELDILSNKIANWLVQNKTEANELVAIVVEKSWEQIAAALGVLKSGAAYLPIDVLWPKDRINYLLKNGKVKNILTKSIFHEKLTGISENINLLSLDDQHNINILNDKPLEREIRKSDLAYVIFTSGSTGEPKGVMIDHKGFMNTVVDINEKFSVTNKDKILAVSSLSFDLSVYDIFGMLSVGGTIVVPDFSEHVDVQNWKDLIEKYKVTIWNSVPALMGLLIEETRSKSETELGSLRLILLSGDWIPVDMPQKIRDVNPKATIISLGGATEASIWSIYYPIQALEDHTESIPYGKPLANQKMYVLNDQFQVCPFWTTGTIFIGGIGIAKGYWSDKKKTDQKFIVHPLTGESLYNTGDLGRQLPNGNIEFLGRNDHQVKIQGYRIELGEIENAIKKLPGITDSVVTSFGTEKNNKKLVAYVVSDPVSVDFDFSEKNRINNFNKDLNNRSASEPNEIKGSSDKIIPFVKQKDTEERNKQLKFAEYYSTESLNIDLLSKYLQCLCSMQHESHPIPLYQYSSFGSLNSVQCYVLSNGNLSDLPQGAYYLNQHTCELIQVADNIDKLFSSFNLEQLNDFKKIGTAIFFIADLNVIIPQYGALSLNFCFNEAANMTGLLMDQEQSIGLAPVNIDQEFIRSCFMLEKNHVVITSYALAKNEYDFQTSFVSGNDFLNTTSQNELNEIEKDLLKSNRQGMDYYEQLNFKLNNKRSRDFSGKENTYRLVNTEQPSLIQFVQKQPYRSFAQKIIPFADFNRLFECDSLSQIAPPLPKKAGQSTDFKDLFQIYIYIKPNRVEFIDGGIYYLNIESNSIELITIEALPEDMYQGAYTETSEESAFSVFIVANICQDNISLNEITEHLYVYEVGLFEYFFKKKAVHAGLGLCPVGNMNFSKIRSYFSLREDQVMIQSYLGGSIDPERMDQWMQPENKGYEKQIAKWKSQLEQTLPKYMVPGLFIPISAIPLSANGKVNKKMLPDPAGFIGQVKRKSQKNYSVDELKIIKICKDILKVEHVYIEDNIFALGANSLSVIKIVADIYEEFNVNIEFSAVFSALTIDDILKSVKETESADTNIPLAQTQEFYDVSNAQKRLWLLDQVQGGKSIAYNGQKVYVLNGMIDLFAIENAFRSLIERHEILRTVFVAIDGVPKQQVLHRIDFNLSVIDLYDNESSDESFARLCINDEATPFNLKKGPLMRATLAKISDKESRLILTIHHIICDAKSMDILEKELIYFYQSHKNQQEITLPELRIQYKDFTLWQNSKLTEKEIKKHNDFWVNKFKGGVPVLMLPTDFERPKFKTYNGNIYSFIIDEVTAKALLDKAIAKKTTVFILLLTCLKSLLYRLTNQTDITIGTSISGRNQKDLENQIGLYLNQLALRTKFNADDTFLDLLISVKQTAREAYKRQNYPFDLVLEGIDINRDYSRSPLFDLMLDYIETEKSDNRTDTENSTGEVLVTNAERIKRVSKFDITMVIAKIDNYLEVSVEYNTDLFKEKTIKLFSDQFVKIIGAVLIDDTSRINEISMSNTENPIENVTINLNI